MGKASSAKRLRGSSATLHTESNVSFSHTHPSVLHRSLLDTIPHTLLIQYVWLLLSCCCFPATAAVAGFCHFATAVFVFIPSYHTEKQSHKWENYDTLLTRSSTASTLPSVIAYQTVSDGFMSSCLS